MLNIPYLQLLARHDESHAAQSSPPDGVVTVTVEKPGRVGYWPFWLAETLYILIPL